MRQHALSTAITVVSVALATGLTMAVFSIQHQTRGAFTGGRVGFDAVLGARGSQLQLVLNPGAGQRRRQFVLPHQFRGISPGLVQRRGSR